MDAKLVSLSELTTIGQGLSASGRAAGARPGSWKLDVVSVGDIQDDRLLLDNVGTIAVEQNAKTDKHLLRPHDVLVTARSTVYKAALVQPRVSRTVADATLLVIRPREFGLGPYLWWYLTSAVGRSQVQARMSGSTVLALSAGSLGELMVPLPEPRVIDQIADLVDASERAYVAAIEAAHMRRAVFRNALVGGLLHAAGNGNVRAQTRNTTSMADEEVG